MTEYSASTRICAPVGSPTSNGTSTARFGSGNSIRCAAIILGLLAGRVLSGFGKENKTGSVPVVRCPTGKLHRHLLLLCVGLGDLPDFVAVQRAVEAPGFRHGADLLPPHLAEAHSVAFAKH